MDCSQEYVKMDMECEPKKSFWRGRSCSRHTGILVLLGTVCIFIFIIMTSVIFSHQERKFSMLESWMSSHTSDLTSVKSDFQITGSDLDNKVSELQNLVSSLSSSVNMSGSSNTITNEMHEKKLSNIETLITDLGSSLSSLATNQEENRQKLDHQKDLMDKLGSALRSKQRITVILPMDMSSSLTNIKNTVEDLISFVHALSYKLSLTNSFTPGCGTEWIPFSNSCYLFSGHSMNWTQAKDYCEEQGALLLKIEDGSKEEWKFVTHLAKPFEYWIGLTDQDTGQWRWVDDTNCTMDKVHWAPGEPNNWKGHAQGGGEDCAHITNNMNINDNHCSFKLNFICKGSKDV
ncbi:C-type lectin domain family 10 member A-like [Siphateles boraxobius]|uniref:C-type lectin domain family 10 member A-like n=1 Tax=Siphateles boraxobius TaxID=180520 RepID=UPI00406349BC